MTLCWEAAKSNDFKIRELEYISKTDKPFTPAYVLQEIHAIVPDAQHLVILLQGNKGLLYKPRGIQYD